MATETQLILEELRTIKEELGFIREHMFDPDSIMTIEEGRVFHQSMKELKEGKTTSLQNLKKELGL